MDSDSLENTTMISGTDDVKEHYMNTELTARRIEKAARAHDRAQSEDFRKLWISVMNALRKNLH